MALLAWDSFDYLDTAHLPANYTISNPTYTTIADGGGRCGTNGLHVINGPGGPGTYGVTIGVQPGDTRMIAGMAVKRIPTVYDYPVWSLLRASDWALRCFMNVSGGFTFWTHQAALAVEGFTSPGGLYQMNVYQYIEWKIDLGASGTVTMQVNGVPVWSQSGIKTIDSAYTTYDAFELGGVSFSGEAYYDDFYLLDGTGTRLNDFLGDSRVERLRPTAPGGRQMWILASGSSHWSAVDDDDMPDDATTRIESKTIGDIDTNVYTDSSLPTGGTVHAVGMRFLASKDQPGNRTIAAVTRQGGVDYVSSTDLSINQDSYTYRPDKFELNPATGSPWTIAEVNVAEFGEKVTN